MSSAVFFSGGACSYMAAKRWKATDPNAVLLFSDTGIEDEDLYRFIEEAAKSLNMQLITVKGKRSFDEMCEYHKAIPNDRMPFCSRELKVEPAQEWMKGHPEVDTLVFGLDWTETHRLPKVEKRWPGYKIVAPMMDRPFKMKSDMLNEIWLDGIEPPRLYAMGMAHNNCGGGCVRNGHAAWRQLRDAFPERFAEWVDREERLGNGHTFSRDRRGGVSQPISLLDLVRVNADAFDFGGCGCFLDEDDAIFSAVEKGGEE